MEEIIKYVIIGLVIYGIFMIAKITNRKAEYNMSADHFTIQYPKLYFWIGIICALLFTALIIISTTIGRNETTTLWVELVFGGFALIGIILVYTVVKFKIIINENNIIVIHPFKKRREFTFEQIDKVKHKQTAYGQLIIYINNQKAFAVTDQFIGYHLLEERLEKFL